jgi:hypothetical protein
MVIPPTTLGGLATVTGSLRLSALAHVLAQAACHALVHALAHVLAYALALAHAHTHGNGIEHAYGDNYARNEGVLDGFLLQ